MADSRSHTLEFARRFRAPRARVFDAFLEPEAIRTWWAPRGWVTPHVELDPRVGGAYRFGMREESGGELMFVHGRYLAIEPPERIVFTYIWEAGGAGERWRQFSLLGVETTVTLEFRDLGEATELLLRHEGFPTAGGRDVHRGGWASNWGCLQEYLEGHHKVC